MEKKNLVDTSSEILCSSDPSEREGIKPSLLCVRTVCRISGLFAITLSGSAIAKILQTTAYHPNFSPSSYNLTLYILFVLSHILFTFAYLVFAGRVVSRDPIIFVGVLGTELFVAGFTDFVSATPIWYHVPGRVSVWGVTLTGAILTVIALCARKPARLGVTLTLCAVLMMVGALIHPYLLAYPHDMQTVSALAKQGLVIEITGLILTFILIVYCIVHDIYEPVDEGSV